MYKLFILLISVFSLQSFAQTKQDYLKENRFNLREQGFHFPQKDFNVIGYGAYHGSAKTEEAELVILNDLLNRGLIQYYLPETDYSTAVFFNEYLNSGDTSLLKDLVYHYGFRVPQERSIEVYEKWIALKELNDKLPENKQIQVVGVDKIGNYKYPIIHLLSFLKEIEFEIKSLKTLKELLENSSTDFSAYYNSKGKNAIKSFIKEYDTHSTQINNQVNNLNDFIHLINNLKYSIDKDNHREEAIYTNYMALNKMYKFTSNPQFIRFGFFHLEKSREGEKGYPSFFTRLIENKVYKKEEVLSVIGYLTDSRVLWQEKYTKDYKYNGYITKGGYGIGDYWLEYFRGIKHLKKTKLSDLTLFRLNQAQSPYLVKEPDLMEIKMLLKKSNKDQVQGMSTLDFIDYGLLISDSKANTPIQEMN